MAGQHIAVGHLNLFSIIFFVPVLVDTGDCGWANVSVGANEAGDRDHNRICLLLPLLRVVFDQGRAEESLCKLRIPVAIFVYSLWTGHKAVRVL